MAKTNTLNNPKILHLAELLDMAPWCALGLMEAVWDYTGKYAPDGGLGRIRDGVIAHGIGWRERPVRLIELLVEAGFIDPVVDGKVYVRGEVIEVSDPSVRFVVHDWAHHCQAYIRKKLKRNKQTYWDGSNVVVSDDEPDDPAGTKSPVTDQPSTSHRPVSDQSVTSQKAVATSKVTGQRPVDDEPKRPLLRAPAFSPLSSLKENQEVIGSLPTHARGPENSTCVEPGDPERLYSPDPANPTGFRRAFSSDATGCPPGPEENGAERVAFPDHPIMKAALLGGDGHATGRGQMVSLSPLPPDNATFQGTLEDGRKAQLLRFVASFRQIHGRMPDDDEIPGQYRSDR